MKTYTVASPEGAQRYGVEVGKNVDIELDEEQERAIVCAGWLNPTTTKQPKEAK